MRDSTSHLNHASRRATTAVPQPGSPKLGPGSSARHGTSSSPHEEARAWPGFAQVGQGDVRRGCTHCHCQGHQAQPNPAQPNRAALRESGLITATKSDPEGKLLCGAVTPPAEQSAAGRVPFRVHVLNDGGVRHERDQHPRVDGAELTVSTVDGWRRSELYRGPGLWAR
jgi:hypothetical protein